MLYDPAGFEPLTDEPWDVERVRASIRRLVARIDDVYDSETLWPANDWDGWHAATPMKNLYVGAAGVLWALDEYRAWALRFAGPTLLPLAKRLFKTVSGYRGELSCRLGLAPEPSAQEGRPSGAVDNGRR